MKQNETHIFWMSNTSILGQTDITLTSKAILFNMSNINVPNWLIQDLGTPWERSVWHRKYALLIVRLPVGLHHFT